MKKLKFSIIEMMVVLAILALLMTMVATILGLAGEYAKKTTTRNTLKQVNGMVSAYYTDYKILPTPGHINPNTFSDPTASTEYYQRIPKGLFQVNQLPASVTKNAELFFDYYNYDHGSLKTSEDFNAKYPFRGLKIPLESWYSGAASATNTENEELSVIAHSSKFLNYYLSGSGFDLVNQGSYWKAEKKWLSSTDVETTFRLNSERSAMVKLNLYFATDETILWDGGSPEKRISRIPEVTSWVFSKPLVYFDYLPKILGPWNAQFYSKNLEEDNYRRLYKYNEKPPIPLADKYAPKKVTLGSDRIIFNANFFGSSSLKDARAQKDAADILVANAAIATANAAALLAAAVTPAQIAAANAAVAAAATATTNANNALAAAEEALKNATPGDLNNSNSMVYMRAHTDNVKNIVDAFNSPIVYITHVNQRKESARTFKYKDQNTGKFDPSKDKSLSAESYLIYSLGPNKADDSNLGENHFDHQKFVDDIIEISGGK